jgi:oxygen-dependent protoporphyrinogen oxidase
MRAMYGGAVDPEAAMLGEDELVALARSEVSRLYGITEAPRFQHVVQWERAIPQPLLGHGDRATRIERGMALLPGLFITGAGLRGVAFADAAQNGARTGKQAAEWLARR